MVKTGVAPKTKLTFDVAQERFRAKPDDWQRQVDYLNTSLEYWFDDMISNDTLMAALLELRD